MINDWSQSFAAAVLALLSGQDPYAAVPTYASPPWALPVLWPLAWVPPLWAMLLPALALLYLSYRRRKPWLIAIVGLSYPFIMTSLWANITWLAMLGVVIGGRLGVVLDTVKPQASIGAIAAELGKCPSWRAWPRLLGPLVVCVLLSAPLWLSWLGNVGDVGSNQHRSVTRLYPREVAVVLGIMALYLAWKRGSAIWGCMASLLIAPYWYVQSIVPLLFLIADHNWRWGVALNAALWVGYGLVQAGVIELVL